MCGEGLVQPKYSIRVATLLSYIEYYIVIHSDEMVKTSGRKSPNEQADGQRKRLVSLMAAGEIRRNSAPGKHRRVIVQKLPPSSRNRSSQISATAREIPRSGVGDGQSRKKRRSVNRRFFTSITSIIIRCKPSASACSHTPKCRQRHNIVR